MLFVGLGEVVQSRAVAAGLEEVIAAPGRIRHLVQPGSLLCARVRIDWSCDDHIDGEADIAGGDERRRLTSA